MADLGPLIVTAATGIVGAGLGLAGGVAVERMRSNDARLARNEARQQERDDFQRQTLIAFQEALGRYVRANGRAWHHDEMAFLRTGKWMATELPSDVDHEFLQSGREARQLIERVRDDELRRRFNEFHSAVSGLSVKRLRPATTDKEMYDAATAQQLQVMELQGALESRLGEVLRTLL